MASAQEGGQGRKPSFTRDQEVTGTFSEGENVTPEVEAGVSRLWYRLGVCPKRMRSDRGH